MSDWLPKAAGQMLRKMRRVAKLEGAARWMWRTDFPDLHQAEYSKATARLEDDGFVETRVKAGGPGRPRKECRIVGWK